MAVIFAPGQPLTISGVTQSRSEIDSPCRANPGQIAAFLESMSVNASGTVFTQGIVKDAAGNILNNDTLASISSKEIFSRVKQRKDLVDYLNEGITKIWDINKNSTSTAITAPSSTDPKPYNFYNNWSDHFAYIRCASVGSYCYTVNSKQCDGVLLFGGASTDGNPRSVKSNANLFEDALAIANGTSYSISTLPSYPATNAVLSQDIAMCVNEKPVIPPPTEVTSVSNFQSTSSSANAAQVLSFGTSGSALHLGATAVAVSNIYACAWSQTVFPFTNGLRIYFRFNINFPGQGFTLALADTATNPSTAMCGLGSDSLGYSGNNGTTSPIMPPKIGLEIDTSSNAAKNDPTGRHAAFIFWDLSTTSSFDNKHGSCGQTVSGVTPPCNPAASPGLRSPSMPDLTDIYVRLDIVPDTSVTNGYKLFAYITKSTFDKSLCELDGDSSGGLTSDVADVSTCLLSPTLESSIVTTTSNVYLGFTTGQTGTSSEKIVIDNFNARTR